MAMMYAASYNLTFARTHSRIHTQTHTSAVPPPPGIPFFRRRSTGCRWLWAPSLHPSLLPPQLLVGGEECPCPSPPSPPLLLHYHLHCLHFLLLLLPSAPQLHLLLPAPSRFLAPGVESGAADGRAAGEEAEEDYGVCWSSLCGEETDERKRK